MENIRTLFMRELPPKVDALAVALEGLQAGENEALSTIRWIARMLRETAGTFGFTAIANAAQGVEDCGAGQFGDFVKRLIKVLREQVAKSQALEPVVLLVGGDAESNKELIDGLAEDGRGAVWARGTTEAAELVRSNNVMLIIFRATGHSDDDVETLRTLREDPIASSIRLRVLGWDDDDAEAAEGLLQDGDEWAAGPPDLDAARKWVGDSVRQHVRPVAEGHRDVQTGLLNQAAFRAMFQQCADRAREHDDPISVAGFALDNHAQLLDKYGMGRSVEALQHVGLLLSGSLRATDIVARWGMSEFVAIFPGEDQSGGIIAAEKVLAKLRKENHKLSEDDTPLTLSGGVVVVRPGQALEDVMAETERYLLVAQSAGGDHVVSSSTDMPRRKKRVLLLHSGGVVGNALKQLLEGENFQVTLMGSVEEATEAIGNRRYHVVAIEKNVQGGRGFDALKAMRGFRRRSRVPIVMLLDKPVEKELIQALELGANDYLVKPYTPSTLLAHIRRMLLRGGSIGTTGGQLCRALIVAGDSRDLLMASSAMNSIGGFRIYLSNGWEEASRRIAEVDPQVLIVDCDMGGLDQAFLVDMVRRCAVILWTESVAKLQQSISQGARGVISRPTQFSTFCNQIETMLNLGKDAKRVMDRSDHLNKEIQRIVQPG